MLQLLETRLDNVIFRLGFASSRAEARLLVTHGHFSVNNRRTDVPSMLLGAGDAVSVRTESRRRTFFKGLADVAETRTPPAWLDRDLKNLAGTYFASRSGLRLTATCTSSQSWNITRDNRLEAEGRSLVNR